ncbi:RNA dependent RNA polymerase-domain-containing protein [Ampelomyces quisqualis]|uniref:RNA-dependent RNA polymerase n=1 Tax=Ampelomyces quisqualis TaxID=50730 RepID=A0A6A5R0T5_AMPQU|nr:RNA dependent RNA polymerase-domain-containing protein [Ampelomyces quisqualis]
MEVYLHGLPPHLTDFGLKEQLGRFTKALRISDWSCQKPRKRAYGFLTFLHPEDGERFLAQHQQAALPGAHRASAPLRDAQIVILGIKISCRRSNKNPDSFLLKSLVKAAEDRLKAATHVQPPKAKIIFALQSLSGGYYEYDNNELVYAPEVEWTALKGTAKFAKRAIVLEFEGRHGKQRIEIPYRIVEAMAICSRHAALTLTLWEPPRFYQADNSALIEAMASLSIGPRSTIPQRSRLVRPVDTTSGHPDILGQLLIYRICVSPVDFDLMTSRLHEQAILTMYYRNIMVLPLHRRKGLHQGMENLKNSIQVCSSRVPFNVLFQMEALVRNGFLPPWIVGQLLDKMKQRYTVIPNLSRDAAIKDSGIMARAVKKLFSQIPFPGPDVDPSVFDVDEIWKFLEDNARAITHLIQEKARSNLAMVHKVNITPTGMTLHGPEPEAKNRVLRRFPEHNDHFIRVQFCDENGADLQFNSKISNDHIYGRFRNVFKNGIYLGGRAYGFLGFSHSSLRSHTAWFVAPFVHKSALQTYFSIISFLGDFQDITSPARCAARIGQAFSETPLAISLSEFGIKTCEVRDVTSKDGSRVFSDGVGTVSESVVEAIRATIAQRKGTPTCFQIRWAGAKGMLALDTRLEGDIMCFRPSMIKFQSKASSDLEICDIANKPIPMVLNRQMIKILEDMGVQDSWFLRRQDERMRALQLITAHIANTVHFLNRQNVASLIGFPQLLRRLDSIGIDYRADQFMASVVEATVLRELRLLKYKARIPVPQGVTLFGIMDETGYLDEGEVFITFDNAHFIQDLSMDLDNCRMIITRSPALHPGDIQLATNVIPPDHHPLRSLRNCIVFSQKGERDLPSCLSGGDLDGDIYGIIWDPEAVQGCVRTYQPADYPRVQQLDIGRVVQREDMSNFFIQFMATDQLGVIAVKHMIVADQRDAGTVDPDCILLAEMHSTGVDYSKTGIAVNMALLKKVKHSKYRPDFLSPAPPANIKDRTEICFDEIASLETAEEDEDDDEGPKYLTYRSDKINGKLYRAIDEEKIWYRDIKISANRSTAIWDEIFRYLVAECNKIMGGFYYAHAKGEAWEIRHAYEDAISNAALEYSEHASKEITELEVFTGTIFNSSGVQTPRQRDGSVRLKDEFDRILSWTASMIRKGSHPSAALSEDILALSIACLDVGIASTQRATRLSMGRRKAGLESFRVVAACCAFRELDAAVTRTAQSSTR